MRLGRVGWGVVALCIAGLSWAAFAPLETFFLGTSPTRAGMLAAVAIAVAVMWLADRFGLMSAPYSGSTLGLANDRTTILQQAKAQHAPAPKDTREGVWDLIRYLRAVLRDFHGGRRP